jgi:hypothetical protein
VSHAKLADQYRHPYSAMVEYLDALQSAGVPAGRVVLAALGPKMLVTGTGAGPETLPRAEWRRLAEVLA